MVSSKSQGRPQVSILLPTHNRVDVLHFAIHSVLAQTFQDFELLIVGDGCTDNTAEMIRDFSDPRIQWFDLPKGPNFGYVNRNIVLRLACGEYIAYMAHDDLWLSDHLEKLLSIFSDETVEIVYSRPLWVIPRGMIAPGLFNLNHAPTLKAFLNKEFNAIPSDCVIHRKDCFSKYGYWDDTLPIAGDWDMWTRIIKGGGEKNFAYLNDSTCLHFKANWRDESYDIAFGFRFWRGLFDSGQMPGFLKVEIKDNVTEQEAIWEIMSSVPQEWNKKIRSAIQQVIDLRAFQGNSLIETLATFNDDFVGEPLLLHPILGFDFFPLIEYFKQLLINTKYLDEMKNTLTWKMYQYIINIYLIRKFYLVIIMPIRQRLFNTK